MQSILLYDLVDDNGVERTVFGHRLIAGTFHPGGVPDDHYVYHADGNPVNNAYVNLRVLSPEDLAGYTSSDLPGEIWFTVTGLRHAMRRLNGAVVSNVGRVNVRGRKSFGSLADTPSPTFKHKGSTWSVAYAVCTAFRGVCTQPDSHVVHQDGNCANTHPANLKWKTM